MVEKLHVIVCFQSKKSKNKLCMFIISNNLKRYFEKIVTNVFFSIFWSTAALKAKCVLNEVDSFVY